MIKKNIDLEQLKSSADRATSLMKALANRDRLLLLCQICQGERCVSELEEALNIQQPTLSQQLTVLREEGLVSTRREGKYIYYSVSDLKVLKVMEVLYSIYCQ